MPVGAGRSGNVGGWSVAAGTLVAMSGQQLPPGPWRWERVVPQAPVEMGFAAETELAGLALVAADGTWLVWSEFGYGSPDVHPAVRELLAAAWQVQALSAERDEARAWARGYEHKLFAGGDVDHPPAWLTAPLTAP